MNIRNILVALNSVMFFMIGADKFFAFLEPPCSLMGNISTTVWSILGASQIVAGVLIWMPKYRKYVAGFFAVFMLIFTVIHLIQNTSDFGGSLIMGLMLALIAWNPKFIRGKNP